MGKVISKNLMMADRLCGLKYYDQAVAKVGKNGIIDEMINLLDTYYQPRPIYWSHCQWALGNAIAVILRKPQIGISFNLNDVFDAAEMQTIANRTGTDVNAYQPAWPRK